MVLMYLSYRFLLPKKGLNDFMYYMAYYYGSRYLVTGDLLDERGSDGEPLIENVKIIEKL